jgi:hypothetical protein
MSPICPNLYTKIWILWDLICIHPLIAVLDILETQNFAGLLLVTIQTDPTCFGTDPGNFWKMFILVHFAHSEAQEPRWRSSLVLVPSIVPSIQPYPSNGTIIGLPKPFIHPKIDVPDLSQFVYKNLDTLRLHVYTPSNCRCGRPRDSKLRRVTPSNDINRSHMLWNRSGQLLKNVHSRSFCSFWGPGAELRVLIGPST